MNPHTLEVRGHRDRWAITTEPYPGGRLLILNRDGWAIRVAFDGAAPANAMIRKPGQDDFAHLGRRRISQYVRGDRAAMSAFSIGDLVVITDRVGTVLDIEVEPGSPTRANAVRLRVGYDDGGEAEPYTRFALAYGPNA